MTKQVAVEFKGIDSGVASTIQKLRQQSNQLGQDLIGDARKYSQVSKEQVGYLNEMISAIQRRNQLDKDSNAILAKRKFEERTQKASTAREKDFAKKAYQDELSSINSTAREDRMQIELLRELIDTVKLTSKEEIAEDKEAVVKNIQEVERRIKRGEQVDDVEAFKVAHQKELLSKTKKEEGKQQGIFNALMALNLLSQLANHIQPIPKARSENDLITPGFSIAGATVGSGIGSLAEAAFTAGQIEFGVMGAELGRQIGEFTGASITRSFEERSRLADQENILRGMTGKNPGRFGLTGYGLDYSQGAELAQQVFKAQGRIGGAQTAVEGAIASERAFGLNREQVLGMYSDTRLTRQNVPDQIVSTLRDAISEGIITENDRTLFGEILQNQSNVIEMFSQTSERVTNQQARASMMSLSQFGGAFNMRDPRSMQRFGTINQALSNPQNDFAQALNIQAIRGISGMENASFLEIMKMQEQGMKDPRFLKSVIDQIKSGGGTRDTQIMDISSRLGVNLEDAERLFKGDMRPISEDEMTNARGTRDLIEQEGARNTNFITQQQAKITNAYVDSFITGTEEVANMYLKAMNSSTDEIAKEFKEKIGAQIDELTTGAKEKVTEEYLNPTAWAMSWGYLKSFISSKVPFVGN